MAWLDEFVGPHLERLLKEAATGLPTPTQLFSLDDVLTVIRIAEDGLKAHNDETRTSFNKRALAAARNPNHSFSDQPVFGPGARDRWKALAVLPAVLRRSLLVTVCSHVEFVLVQWCKGLASMEVGMEQPNLGGSAVSQKCFRYLHKVAGLDVGDFESWEEWRVFEAYWEARNAIVHASGIIEKPRFVPANESDKERQDREAWNRRRERRRGKILQLELVTLDTSGLLIGRDDEVVHVREGACEHAARNAKALLDRVSKAYLDQMAGPEPAT